MSKSIKTIKYNNTNLDYFNNKLDILIELNKIREAEECIKINLLNQKNDKNLLCQIARIHNLNGNAKNALEILKTCIETYPDYDYAYYNLAFTYSASGEQDNAQKALEKCIEINPKNHSAHLAYSRIKKYKNNDKHLEVVVKQLTTKVLITYEGDTPLSRREVIDLYHIQYINKIIIC